MKRPRVMPIATAAVFAAALVLAGCGRKGPLDPPPVASAVPQATVQPDEQPDLNAAPPGAEQAPAVAPGQRRRFPLDVLID